MRIKGVFEIPADDVQDEILRCYFEHVHFFIPVVDVRSFLNNYTQDRHRTSPLLLWSMNLAAANVTSQSESYHGTWLIFPSLQVLIF